MRSPTRANQQNSFVVRTSVGVNNRRALIGSSPLVGDIGDVGLFVPTLATAIGQDRYLFRLAGVGIPDGCCGHLKSIRQMVTIAAYIRAQGIDYGQRVDLQNVPAILVERMVTTPFWSFPDGNVSFHLTAIRPSTPPPQGWMRSVVPVLPVPSGTSLDPMGVDPGLMASQDVPIAAYTTWNRGIPPGDPVGGLGVCYDACRFPWATPMSAYDADLWVQGPCNLVYWASVRQTDPTTRLQPIVGPGPENTGLECCQPEDAFWMTFPDSARYHRVAGEITVEIIDDCPAKTDKPCCSQQPDTQCCQSCAHRRIEPNLDIDAVERARNNRG